MSELAINHDTFSAVQPGKPGSAICRHLPLVNKWKAYQRDGKSIGSRSLTTVRNGVSETTIHGAVAWAHGDEVIHSFGGNVLCYGRSMMKPFMLKAFTDELSDCSWEQKAIAVASHNGDTEHVATAQSLLSESEWPLMLTLDVPLINSGVKCVAPVAGTTRVRESMQLSYEVAERRVETSRVHAANP